MNKHFTISKKTCLLASTAAFALLAAAGAGTTLVRASAATVDPCTAYTWEADGGNFLTGNLYLYRNTQTQKVYPSDSELDLSASAYHGYEFVSYESCSYVYYKNSEYTVSLTGTGSAIVSYTGNKGTAVGQYTTIANITADEGDDFAIENNASLANGESYHHGAPVSGKEVMVGEKVWYVVAPSNALVTAKGGSTEYTYFTNKRFGDVLPQNDFVYLKYGDVASSDDFGKENDPVSLRLYYGDARQSIGGEFSRSNQAYYLHQAMPAGNYELEVTVKSVTAGSVTYAPLTKSYFFTVTPLALPDTELTAFCNYLNNRSLTFDWDGNVKLADDDANVKERFNALYNRVEAMLPDVRGSVWENEAFASYYGKCLLRYNFDSMHNVSYYDRNGFLTQTIKSAAPGSYRIYYTVEAAGFLPLIDSGAPDYETARRNYNFNATIIRTVYLPHIPASSYTGSSVKAPVGEKDLYYAKDYEGFVDVGEHPVTLVLNNPQYYQWDGKALGESECETTYEIVKTGNKWEELPDVVRWEQGKYRPAKNPFTGIAAFGEINYVITDINNNVVYDSANNVNKLRRAKAGAYIMRASVTATENFDGLNEEFSIQILEREKLPWWATMLIVVGSLGAIAGVIILLWKKDVFRILNDKLIVSIRTNATMDATIAVVRANRVAASAKQSVAEVEAKEKAEAREKARKEAAAARKAMTPEEKAAAVAAKAEAVAKKLERMNKKAAAMQEKAQSSDEQPQADAQDDLADDAQENLEATPQGDE